MAPMRSTAAPLAVVADTDSQNLGPLCGGR